MQGRLLQAALAPRSRVWCKSRLPHAALPGCDEVAPPPTSQAVTSAATISEALGGSEFGQSPRGDLANFEPRPPAVRRFVTAFSGLSQPHLLTAARLGRGDMQGHSRTLQGNVRGHSSRGHGCISPHQDPPRQSSRLAGAAPHSHTQAFEKLVRRWRLPVTAFEQVSYCTVDD